MGVQVLGPGEQVLGPGVQFLGRGAGSGAGMQVLRLSVQVLGLSAGSGAGRARLCSAPGTCRVHSALQTAEGSSGPSKPRLGRGEKARAQPEGSWDEVLSLCPYLPPVCSSSPPFLACPLGRQPFYKFTRRRPMCACGDKPTGWRARTVKGRSYRVTAAAGVAPEHQSGHLAGHLFL